MTRTLASLADLRDRGAITPEEYEAKKADLLSAALVSGAARGPLGRRYDTAIPYPRCRCTRHQRSSRP